MAQQDQTGEPTARRLGRRPSTSRAQLSRIALELFSTRGFEATTADDIAEAAGIGRRTLFRYSASKNDLAWGEFDMELERLRQFFDNLPTSLPLPDALTRAVREFNNFPPEELARHRARIQLLRTVPALIAHSALRYAAWRQVIAEYVARRENLAADDLRPQAIAWACLGAALAAYEQWLKNDDAELLDLLESAFAVLADVFTTGSPHAPGNNGSD